MSQNSSSELAKNKLYPRPQRVSKFYTITQAIDSNKAVDQSVQPEKNRAGIKHNTAFGFEAADIRLAMERKRQDSIRFYKGKQIPFGVDLDHFKVYGPGIYLFFQFLWKLSLLFLVLSLISLLPIIYNYIQGNKFLNSIPSMSVYVSRISIANFWGDNPSLTATQQMENTQIPKMINCVSDLLSCFLVMLFYFYWTRQSVKRTQDIKRQFKMPNYFTLQLKKFPQNATEHQIYKFFSKFGLVTEVAPVKNYQQTIQLSKQIYEHEVRLKQLKMQQLECPQIGNQIEIQRIQQKVSKLYKQLQIEQKKTKQQVIKYFITFSTPLQSTNTVKEFKKVYGNCCSCFTDIPQDYMLNGCKMQIQPCHNQPGQIIWQNVHVTWKTRWMRAIVQFFLLLVCVAAGFFVISLLNILSPATSYQSINTSSYTTSTIKTQTNSSIIESWCLKNTDSATSTTDLSNICSSYINNYYLNILLKYSITVFVIFIKTILKNLVVFIAKFQRYKQQTQQSIDIVKNLVIIYVITTVVIGFLLQANLFGIRFKNLIPNLLNNSYLTNNASQLLDYSSFQNTWYIDIGYQIWFTWVILAVSPHVFMPIYYYLVECIKQHWASNKKLQKKMEQALRPEEFQIQDHYANIIMVFLVGLAFSGGIPSMTILTFIGLITRYIYLKFLFIRFCKVPKSIDQALNDAVLSYFPWALLIHFCMTIWMYSSPSIFATQNSIFSDWYSATSSAFVQFISQILGMAISSYYYTLTAGAMLLCILIKQVIYDFFVVICRKQTDMPEEMQKQDSSNDLVEMARSQRVLTSSYRIQNNPNYFEILSIKQKMKNRLQRSEFSNPDQKV